MHQSLGGGEKQIALRLNDANGPATTVEDRAFGGGANTLGPDLQPFEPNSADVM
jgi:hypothetical protein